MIPAVEKALNNAVVQKMISKEYINKTILLIILVFSFLISLLCFTFSGSEKRCSFIYPSADDGKYIIEYRNLTKKTIQGDLRYYIDELVLGSQVERTRSLFTPGTKVLSCFVRNGVLYLDLSADILRVDESGISIREGVDLLEKNIRNNFPSVHKIELFIDGKRAFEN